MALIGIDLGTSNSVIAVWRDGRAQVIPGADAEALTPSVVGMSDRDELLVGRAAWERLTTHPNRTAAAFKRSMGSATQLKLGRQSFRPEELSALVLKKLIADASAALGESISEAVISVPAYFSDAQRRATKVAGELAGIRVERLVNEPTAAAIAYGLTTRAEERTVLIIDLGGGTLDVSLLESFDGVMQVHATAGDNYLGGEDFDRAIAGKMLSDTGLGRFDSLKRETAAALLRESRRAKHRLTSATEANLSVDHRGLLSRRQVEWSIDRPGFEALAAPLLDRIRRTVERAIRDARIEPNGIDDIVLVGGATRMPMIRALVARLFGRLPHASVNPDEVVALGAAAQAALMARDSAVHDLVLTDVAPYTLGLEVSNEVRPSVMEAGYFLPIIERNSRIPISPVERLRPVSLAQSQLECRVFQGESRLVRNNIELGVISVPLGYVTGGKDERGVDVRFTYDVNGILEVQLNVVDSKIERRLVIDHSGRGLSAAQIEQSLAKLAALKVHPRDQDANRAELSRAERIYEESLGDARTAVAALTQEFERVLERQDPGESDAARAELRAALDGFDRDTFR